MLDPLDRPSAALELVPLCRLGPGETGRLARRELAEGEGCLLAAMGLTEGCLLVVRSSGDPLIVEVRATRIGISRRLAERLLVRSDPRATP